MIQTQINTNKLKLKKKDRKKNKTKPNRTLCVQKFMAWAVAVQRNALQGGHLIDLLGWISASEQSMAFPDPD